MRSSGFALQRTCAAPILGFSGARSNLTSETLWIICALLRKVSYGSPTFMPMCSQRNIAARSGLGEGHLELPPSGHRVGGEGGHAKAEAASDLGRWPLSRGH